MFDIVSDFLVFVEYINGVVQEFNPWYTGFTLAFIYLPSLNIVATLCGPGIAGPLGIVWGTVIAIIGLFISPLNLSILWSLVPITLGVAMVVLAIVSLNNSLFKPFLNPIPDFLLHFIIFPLLIVISPLLYVIIKFLAIINPSSKFLESQDKVGGRGETILEAAPQLTLQCYIVLLSLSPSRSQLFSIGTSILALPIPIVEQYETIKSKELGIMSIFKIFVLLPASLFKLFSFAIICLFFRWPVTMYISIGYLILLGFFLLITFFYYNKHDGKHNGWKQLRECFTLSWLTITNIERNETAALFRMVSSIFWNTAHSITIAVILYICNDDPSYIDIFGNVKWSELALVQDISMLNILLITTIGLGWISLWMDMIYANVKYCYKSSKNTKDQTWNGFWQGALLLEGLSYLCKKTTDGQTSSKNFEEMETTHPAPGQLYP